MTTTTRSAERRLDLLPPRDEMLAALSARDRSYDGLFYAGITTTGVFCRPSCPARDPRPEHVEFYATTREALVAGFRPCKRCRPLDPEAGTPEWAARLIGRVEADPSARISDADLRAEGLDPAAVRRWFKKTHGMTFQAYCRARRLGEAFVALRSGGSIDEAVFDHGWGSYSGFRTAFGKLAGAPPGTAAAAPDGSLIRLAWLETPVGPLIAGATEDTLVMLEYPDRRMIETQLDTLRRRFGRPLAPGASPILAQLREQLGEYFAGRRRAFDLPLAYPGTPFQLRVWEALLRIPYGETRTYAELAREIGAPGAARAVGSANGANRLAIVVPCHRVVAAGGGLGGYGGGLWRKLRLLETEGALPPALAAAER
ncbi:MAG TPA: methylated-DNA--[protein]-cysteine S-methyltransferase [Thermoleophilia bacterium]|nr:methylated-DNA--[protein]-cysteine S-methyltransferase [Thermoleophilia bacterium]